MLRLSKQRYCEPAGGCYSHGTNKGITHLSDFSIGALNTEAAPPAASPSTPPADLGNPAGAGTPPAAVEPSTTPAGQSPTPESIPYQRFQEVNSKVTGLEAQLAEFSQWKDYIEMLKTEHGTPAQVRVALDKQQLDQFANNVASQLQQQVDNGLLDPTVAEQQYQNTLRQRELDTQLTGMKQWQLDQQITSLKVTYPEMDDQIVRAMAQSGADPTAIAKMTHERVTSYADRKLTEYNAAKAATAAAPEAPGGGQTLAAQGVLDPKKPLPWSALLKR